MRMISDNGPLCIARGVRDVIRVLSMTHGRTAPYDPQSNGQRERCEQTLKVTTIGSEAPHAIEDARRLVTVYVAEYTTKRLHSAIGSITPADRLAGRAAPLRATHDHRLEAARAARSLAHRAAAV